MCASIQTLSTGYTWTPSQARGTSWDHQWFSITHRKRVSNIQDFVKTWKNTFSNHQHQMLQNYCKMHVKITFSGGGHCRWDGQASIRNPFYGSLNTIGAERPYNRTFAICKKRYMATPAQNPLTTCFTSAGNVKEGVESNRIHFLVQNMALTTTIYENENSSKMTWRVQNRQKRFSSSNNGPNTLVLKKCSGLGGLASPHPQNSTRATTVNPLLAI